MFAKIMRKRITVFGRSIPLAAIALAVTTTVVLAAFLLTAQITGTADTTAPPALTHLATWTCSVTGKGTVNSCITSGRDLTFNANGIDDDSVVRTSRDIRNDGPVSVDVTFVFNANSQPVQAALIAGAILPGGGLTTTLTFEYTYAGATPSLTILPHVVDITYANQ